MKNLLAAGVSALALLSVAPALAADLPARMVTKAPAYVQVYNWTGFYVGVHGGYGWALRTIARDATSEAADIAEALTDDTLTDAAKAALTAAGTQATATATAAQAAAGTSAPQSGTPGTDDVAADGPAGKPRDCPPGAGRQGGDQGGGAPRSEAAPAAA